MMELRHLRYFVALAEDPHFGRAAARLGISQPPLSRAIRDLEVELGVALFRHSRRGTALTDAGQRFLERARHLLTEADRAAAAARAWSHGSTGNLAVGFFTSMASGRLPDLLRRFRAAHPDIDVELHEHAHEQLIAGLARGRVHVILLPMVETGVGAGILDRLTWEMLWSESMLVAVPETS